MRAACFVLLAWASTVEAGELSVEAEARLLSRYPAGRMPVDPEVMTAIQALAEDGSNDEISLLRSIVAHERPEVESAAASAIAAIRERERGRQRIVFADQLPDRPELERASRPLRTHGLGLEEATCVAYVSLLLADSGSSPRPWRADTALKEAALLEDQGDIPGALHQYALLAAHDDSEAWTALSGYGVDPERLLLGLLAHPTVAKDERNDAAILEVLVQRGGTLTLTVLTERLQHPSVSDRATAEDALTRMHDQSEWAALNAR